jgi:hypothetical protein
MSALARRRCQGGDALTGREGLGVVGAEDTLAIEKVSVAVAEEGRESSSRPLVRMREAAIAGSNIETFDVRLEGRAGEYDVIADSSYGGTYRGHFHDDIDRTEIDRLQVSLLRDAVRGARDIGSVDESALPDSEVPIDRLGRALFDAAFAGEVESELRDTMALA